MLWASNRGMIKCILAQVLPGTSCCHGMKQREQPWTFMSITCAVTIEDHLQKVNLLFGRAHALHFIHY